MVQHVFPNLHGNYRSEPWIRERSILTNGSGCIRDIYSAIGELGNAKEYLSTDTLEKGTKIELQYPTELFESMLRTKSLAGHGISVKRGLHDNAFAKHASNEQPCKWTAAHIEVIER